MKYVFVAILAVSAVLMVVLHVPPLATLEVPLQGGNSFIPRIFGSTVILTIDAFALGVAIWLIPSLRLRSRVAKGLSPGDHLFVVQRYPELARALATVGPRVLIPTVARAGVLRFHGSRDRVLDVTVAGSVDVDPTGYRERFPTIDVTSSLEGEERELSLVVARQGAELLTERRLERLDAIVDRLWG